MMQHYFLIRLLDDVVISQRAATTGGHVSLNHLPGATLLGAVAAQLYRDLSPAEQLAVFHSGQVRFATALPVTVKGCPGYPAPACWHYQKGESKDDRSILNHQHAHGDKQPVQYRDEFFTHTGEFFTPAREFRLKTAIDADTGRSADKQLFGYTALSKGSLFWGKVEADDGSISPARFAEIRAILQKGVRLGRSRSAEYGRVAITPLDEEQAAKLALPRPEPIKSAFPELVEGDAERSAVTLWLLADAALQDEYGQPSLQPTAKAVGLPDDFELIPAKTFIRSTRYAPFNAHRKYRELERQVLMMGSVLHFSGTTPVSAQTLQKIQEQGIGLYRQNGLGRVWVNPQWLAKAEPKPEFIDKKSPKVIKLPLPSAEVVSAPQQNPVFHYLQQRQSRASHAQEIEKLARAWADELKQVYQSAKALEAYAGNVCVGPSRTQWGRVREVAEESRKARERLPQLQDKLFKGDHAVCKDGDAQWGKRIYLGEKQTETDTFRKWFETKIQQQQQQQPSPELIARFARLATDIADKAGCKTEEETA